MGGLFIVTNLRKTNKLIEEKIQDLDFLENTAEIATELLINVGVKNTDNSMIRGYEYDHIKSFLETALNRISYISKNISRDLETVQTTLTEEVSNKNNYSDNYIHTVDFGKEFESCSNYNFYDFSTPQTIGRDLVKKFIPDYQNPDNEQAVEMVLKTVTYLLKNMLTENRIVFTEEEKLAVENSKKLSEELERDLNELSQEYGSGPARVILSNVRTSYGNNFGHRNVTFQEAKKWAIDNNLYDDIVAKATRK